MYLGGRTYRVTAFDGRDGSDDDFDVGLEDQERTEAAVGRKKSVKPESAVRTVVRLIRIDCPDCTVKSQYGLDHYHCSSVRALPALEQRVVH